MDKYQKASVSILDGAESDVKALVRYTKNNCKTKGSPRKSEDYLLCVENLEMLLQQLILRLRADVDKLWICEHDVSEEAALEALENNVTILLQQRIWGERETVISCLVKLVGMMDKMIGINQHLEEIQQEQAGDLETLPLSQEDEMLIERYMQRQMSEKNSSK